MQAGQCSSAHDDGIKPWVAQGARLNDPLASWSGMGMESPARGARSSRALLPPPRLLPCLPSRTASLRGSFYRLGHIHSGDEVLSARSLSPPSPTSVLAGVDFFCFDLALLCRRGDFGRLGHGHSGDEFLPRPVAFFSDIPVRAVACGDAHTLVLTESGSLYSFGRNQNGQLGLGSTTDSLAPQQVATLKV